MMMINIVGLLGLLLSSSLGSSVMVLSSPSDPILVKNHPAEVMESTEKLSSKEQEKAVDDHLIVAQEKAAAASEVFDEVTRLLEDVTAGKLAAASDSIQSKPEENFQKTEKYIQETIEKSRDAAASVGHTVLDTVDSAKEKISETAATAKDTAARVSIHPVLLHHSIFIHRLKLLESLMISAPIFSLSLSPRLQINDSGRNCIM
jgi:hypothetical protein